MEQSCAVFKEVIENLCDGVRLIDKDMKVVYWNKGAEMITGYKSTELIGATCTDKPAIIYDNDKLNICDESCCHNVALCKQVTEENAFIRHKEGYLIPVLMCVFPIKNDSGEVMGVAEMFNDNSWKVAALKRIEELNKITLIDPLTGVGNRRFAEMTINSKLEELKRYDLQFGISYYDIDNFKNINDTYGHNYGDDLIKIFARSLSAGLRSYDSVCRMGGDEFLVITSNIETPQTLNYLTTRISELACKSSISINGKEIFSTVSVGATMALKDDSIEELIQRADSLMYKSKAAGKNRITIE